MSLSFLQPVQSNTTAGVAQPSGPGAQSGGGAPPGGMGSMLPMLLPFLILVPFLLMNARRQKKEQAARGSLKKGDSVLTQAGLIGELVDLDERVAKVKIAPGTTVQVLASAVSPYQPMSSDKKKDDLQDLKEAKATASDKK